MIFWKCPICGMRSSVYFQHCPSCGVYSVKKREIYVISSEEAEEK